MVWSATIILLAIQSAPSAAILPSAKGLTPVSRIMIAEIRGCKAADVEPLRACAAYILGVADVLSADRKVCVNSARYDELVVEATRGYVENAKNIDSKAPSYVIEQALTDAFPCRS